MLKAPPLKSSDLHFSAIECHCETCDDNIGPKLKKKSFVILGAYNMFDNKFDQFRTEVCPEIEKTNLNFTLFFGIKSIYQIYVDF